MQSSRGVKTLDFAGTKETVYERAGTWSPRFEHDKLPTGANWQLISSLFHADWPLPKLQEYFKDDTLALSTSYQPPSASHLPLTSPLLTNSWIRIPGSRTGTQRPRQRPQRHCRCPRGWSQLEGGHRGRMGEFSSFFAVEAASDWRWWEGQSRCAVCYPMECGRIPGLADRSWEKWTIGQCRYQARGGRSEEHNV